MSRPNISHARNSFLAISCLIMMMMMTFATATDFFGSTLNAINKIQSSNVNAIKLDSYKNSTFPEYSFIMGDLQSFDVVEGTKCQAVNGTFVKLQTSGNSMVIATVYRPNDQLIIKNCVQVKEDYHFCSLTVDSKFAPVCLKIDDDMKTDGEFEMAINFNPTACLDPSFDLKANCDLTELDIISVYSYPGESATKLRNILVAFVLIVVSLCICCVVTCGLVGYCWMIRRRKQKLLANGSTNARHDELVDEEE